MDGKEYYYRKALPLLRAYFNNEINLDNEGIYPYFWNGYNQAYEQNFWGDQFIKFYDSIEGDPKMAFDVVRFSKTDVGVVNKANNCIMFFWSSIPHSDIPKGKQIYIHYYVCRNFPIFVPIVDRSKYVIDEQIKNAEETETALRFNQFFKDGKEVLEQQWLLAFESNLKVPYEITFDKDNHQIIIQPDNLVIKGR